MAKYNFLQDGALLRIESDIESGLVQKSVMGLLQPSTSNLTDEVLKIFDAGKYKQTFFFSNIGTIEGETPTDMADAYDKINALITATIIAGIGGGGGGTGGIDYNNVILYDTVGDLPITLIAGTIHSFSVCSKVGTTTVTIGSNQTVMDEGESIKITATTTISNTMSIDSCTGEFIATVLTA